MQPDDTRWRVLCCFLPQLLHFGRGPVLSSVASIFRHDTSFAVISVDGAKVPLDPRGENQILSLATEEALSLSQIPASALAGASRAQRRGTASALVFHGRESNRADPLVGSDSLFESSHRPPKQLFCWGEQR